MDSNHKVHKVSPKWKKTQSLVILREFRDSWEDVAYIG